MEDLQRIQGKCLSTVPGTDFSAVSGRQWRLPRKILGKPSMAKLKGIGYPEIHVSKNALVSKSQF